MYVAARGARRRRLQMGCWRASIVYQWPATAAESELLLVVTLLLLLLLALVVNRCRKDFMSNGCEFAGSVVSQVGQADGGRTWADRGQCINNNSSQSRVCFCYCCCVQLLNLLCPLLNCNHVCCSRRFWVGTASPGGRFGIVYL